MNKDPVVYCREGHRMTIWQESDRAYWMTCECETITVVMKEDEDERTVCVQ